MIKDILGCKNNCPIMLSSYGHMSNCVIMSQDQQHGVLLGLNEKPPLAVLLTLYFKQLKRLRVVSASPSCRHMFANREHALLCFI